MADFELSNTPTSHAVLRTYFCHDVSALFWYECLPPVIYFSWQLAATTSSNTPTWRYCERDSLPPRTSHCFRFCTRWPHRAMPFWRYPICDSHSFHLYLIYDKCCANIAKLSTNGKHSCSPLGTRVCKNSSTTAAHLSAPIQAKQPAISSPISSSLSLCHPKAATHPRDHVPRLLHLASPIQIRLPSSHSSLGMSSNSCLFQLV